MTTLTTHYENACFLRDLAENLPSIRPDTYTPELQGMLQRLADEQIAQARHDESVRATVARARASSRPLLTMEEVRASLEERIREAAADGL